MLVARLVEESITQQAKKNWLSYWKHFSRSEHIHCSEANCINKQEQAIFVSNPTDDQKSIYVIPLCKEHSDTNINEIEINDGIELIPINFTL